MENQTKTVVEMDKETVMKIVRSLDKIDDIKDALQELGAIKTPQYYTPGEFMALAKIGRNKFESLKGQLNIVRPSPRKMLIPHSDLLRWFSGKIDAQ